MIAVSFQRQRKHVLRTSENVDETFTCQIHRFIHINIKEIRFELIWKWFMLFRNETDIKSKLKHLLFCSNMVNTSKKMYSSI